MALDTFDEVRKRVRAHDPLTSVEAAERSMEFSGTQTARIHAALTRLKTGTAHEIGLLVGLTVVQVDRRLPELQRAGSAEVIRVDGEDLRRGDYRVWRAKNFDMTATNSDSTNK